MTNISAPGIVFFTSSAPQDIPFFTSNFLLERANVAFAQNDIKTVIVGRREDALQETISLAGNSGSNIYFNKCDISKDSEIVRLKKEISDNYGSVTVLVNNAGSSSKVRSIAYIPKDQWDDVLNVNLKSVYRICQEFLKFCIFTI